MGGRIRRSDEPGKDCFKPIRPEMKNGANLRMFEIPAFGALELGSYGKKNG